MFFRLVNKVQFVRERHAGGTNGLPNTFCAEKPLLRYQPALKRHSVRKQGVCGTKLILGCGGVKYESENVLCT